MHYTFGNSGKWKNKGFVSIINGCLILIAWIVVFVFASNKLSQVFFLIITAALLFSFSFRIYKAVYFFRLPSKDYVVLNEEFLILSGLFTIKKQIPYTQIKQVAKVNDTIVLSFENGGESIIYLDWLDNEDANQLWMQLKGKANSFVQSS
ncbi:hypothetical protein SAMN04487944_10624 [Gracilibacillus ureilyticus]|uniref:Uncharacterized protein n=1 Tax=Gracilibacillus ureilyticus TaxID=531814 RepID=A0A1H9Q453_9BACI|nr:hypothetical protein [Gracilibacillus ureilyticus]SER55231.1 hypothetical protein SAMN04487944_10624 [Gracilibacillus ureilyticus]